MPFELVIFLAMVGVFAAGCFAAKLPVSLSMLLAACAGLLVSGNGLPVRHLVEGTFGYVDTILVIATAMVFMRTVQESGALEALNAVILRRFRTVPALLLPLLMLVAMFPGMITGSSSASVLTAGAVVAPVLILLGLPAPVTGAFIAMAGILGMIAPPVNIPAMIIGGGIDMPYVGFEVPLALLTFPLAVLFSLWFGLPHVKVVEWEVLAAKLDLETYKKYGIRLFLPILVVAVLMVLGKTLPQVFGMGLPVVFLIGAALGLVVGKRFNILSASKAAVNDALPVLGILAGVGMFIQVMTLTGVRGFVVVSALSVPPALLYAAIAVSIPLFGAVSAFGASSVLGVPFLLALLGRDQIVTAAALSLIASLGDFMPPTALSAIFAAQVVGESKYSRVLVKLVVPSLVIIGWALAFIVFSKQIRALY
ncbi:MAG TPA: TRAP transporter large permease subunit [Spirochaetia bacterium]|nr:TRAP transporter large permease subunit [Spirochaetales bacterium]HRY79303.1 TRAP transporter large permease subunit [Spirochaetia bacterium]